MTLTEKISYIKGLAEGLQLNSDDKQTKVIMAIVDLLDDMALTVSDLEDECAELGEQIDAVDEDLAAIEDDFYDDCDDDECCCDECAEPDFYEVECPACHEQIYIDQDMLEDGRMDCPSCGTELEFDLDSCDCCDDEDCDCDDCGITD